MFGFLKRMFWFIKKNWYFYVLILIVGILISLLNLLPANVIASLTGHIEDNDINVNFILLNILGYYLVVMFGS